jgi:hypothetical protein
MTIMLLLLLAAPAPVLAAQRAEACDAPSFMQKHQTTHLVGQLAETAAEMPALTPAPTPALPVGYTIYAGMGSGPGKEIHISALEGTTVPQCADACDQLPSCAGFTMLLDSNTCNLKSEVILTFPPMDGLDKNTYVKEPAVPDGYTMHAGTGSGNKNSPGYSGDGSPLISVLEGTTVPQCADACDQIPNCAGFTMLLDSNKCNLKSAVTLTYPPADGLDKNTYVKEPAVPDGYTMHAGTGSGNRNSPGYSGEGSPLISVLEGTTVPQCADACDQLPNCAGFTMLLDSNKCNLKSAVTLTYPPADGLDKNTYVKEPEPEPEATASPTAAPTAAPAVPTGAPCKPWCEKNTRPWQKKCNWKRSCAGCPQCA